jgi:DNA-binding transcriptional LysR family regulator
VDDAGVPDLDLGQLRLLLELERRGSMRAVAAASGYSTSAVSAKLAALERAAQAELLEARGRGVRLTPAGRRLAGHARAILAAADAARADLGADAPLAGRLSVAAYATALAGDVLHVVRELRATHPALRVDLQEREPDEALELLEDGAVDLAFVYDYALVPRRPPPGVELHVACETPMLLAVPEGGPDRLEDLDGAGWIVNSRGRDDDELLARVAARAGIAAEVRHRADALDVVLALVAAGMGVALVPAVVAPAPGVRLVAAGEAAGRRRMAVATRPGESRRPPVRLVADRVAARARAAASDAVHAIERTPPIEG